MLNNTFRIVALTLAITAGFAVHSADASDRLPSAFEQGQD